MFLSTLVFIIAFVFAALGILHTVYDSRRDSWTGFFQITFAVLLFFVAKAILKYT